MPTYRDPLDKTLARRLLSREPTAFEASLANDFASRWDEDPELRQQYTGSLDPAAGRELFVNRCLMSFIKNQSFARQNAEFESKSPADQRAKHEADFERRCEAEFCADAACGPDGTPRPRYTLFGVNSKNDAGYKAGLARYVERCRNFN